MQLRPTIVFALLVYLIGILIAWSRGIEIFLWFAVGGGLALLNILFAYWVIGRGLNNLRSKAGFLVLLMFKSLSFLLLVAVILMFLKPLVLPFTLGLGIVIFASCGAALWESRGRLKKIN